MISKGAEGLNIQCRGMHVHRGSEWRCHGTKKGYFGKCPARQPQWLNARKIKHLLRAQDLLEYICLVNVRQLALVSSHQLLAIDAGAAA